MSYFDQNQTRTTGTQPTPPYQHGQQFNGYVYDANLHQWLQVNPNATIAGKQEKPSKKLLIGAGLAVVGICLAAVGVANLVADDGGSSSSASTSPTTSVLTPDERFVNAYYAAGYSHVRGENGILDSGYTVCEGLDEGLSERQLVQAGYQGNQDTNGTMGRNDIQAIVDMATTYLCPEYSGN